MKNIFIFCLFYMMSSRPALSLKTIDKPYSITHTYVLKTLKKQILRYVVPSLEKKKRFFHLSTLKKILNTTIFTSHTKKGLLLPFHRVKCSLTSTLTYLFIIFQKNKKLLSSFKFCIPSGIYKTKDRYLRKSFFFSFINPYDCVQNPQIAFGLLHFLIRKIESFDKLDTLAHRPINKILLKQTRILKQIRRRVLYDKILMLTVLNTLIYKINRHLEEEKNILQTLSYLFTPLEKEELFLAHLRCIRNITRVIANLIDKSFKETIFVPSATPGDQWLQAYVLFLLWQN